MKEAHNIIIAIVTLGAIGMGTMAYFEKQEEKRRQEIEWSNAQVRSISERKARKQWIDPDELKTAPTKIIPLEYKPIDKEQHTKELFSFIPSMLSIKSPLGLAIYFATHAIIILFLKAMIMDKDSHSIGKLLTILYICFMAICRFYEILALLIIAFAILTWFAKGTIKSVT